MLSILQLLNPLPELQGGQMHHSTPEPQPNTRNDILCLPSPSQSWTSPPRLQQESFAQLQGNPQCTQCKQFSYKILTYYIPTDKQLIAPPAPIEWTYTQNIKITCKITLGDLYFYPLGTIIEYPKTSCHKPVGHLFEISPVEWVQPKISFAYSLGAPMGQVETWNGQPIYCNLLVNKDGE